MVRPSSAGSWSTLPSRPQSAAVGRLRRRAEAARAEAASAASASAVRVSHSIDSDT